MRGSHFKNTICYALFYLCSTSALAGLSASAALSAELGQCGDPAIPISAIQGSGPSTPLDGEVMAVEGVVVADYQHTSIRGYYIQEEETDSDGNPLTSEGIFVFDPDVVVDVRPRDTVRLVGRAGEFRTETQLSRLEGAVICGGSSAHAVATANPSLPVAETADLERFEGMLARFADQTLAVTDSFNLGRFGELLLSVDSRLLIPTDQVTPGAAANELQALNNRSQIVLDDDSNSQNPPLPPYLDSVGTRRLGDTVTGLSGVLTQLFGTYRIRPVGAIRFDVGNPRMYPPAVNGGVKVASFNVLNYFTTIDTGAPVCGPAGDQGCRGADSAAEFERQRAKIIAALASINADIVGLIELENNTTAALADLVAGLNELAGPGAYAFVDTGTIGADAIKVGFIYKPAEAQPVGLPAILDSSVDPAFNDDRNRPALAHSFRILTDGEVLTVAVNHLKSKGSPCDDLGDPDTGDGQGNCNLTRADAARALADWLAADPTGSGDPDSLIIGDLNAYALEDPVAEITARGYVDLVAEFGGEGHTFVFFGQAGRLDHALASASLASKVTGAAVWHINADEPRVIDYNTEFKADPTLALFQPDPFRSSDHDPVIVGLVPFADADGDGIADADDACPNSIMTATVIVDACNTAVANSIANGCSVADDMAALSQIVLNPSERANRAAAVLANLARDGGLGATAGAAIRACFPQAG